MRLSELITVLPAPVNNMRDVEIRSIEFDSRQVRPGALYVAVKGGRHDGHDFIEDAARAGAVAVITERRVATALPQIIVRDGRDAMVAVAPRFYGRFPQMVKTGVTGTNGKTTTVFLIHSILAVAGKKPGMLGTVYYLGASRKKAVRTTPELLDIFKFLAEIGGQGAQSVVMEVSSHALKMKRVEALEFDVAVFTNLSQDHLDFHQTMDDYRRSKLHLFSRLKPDGCAVYNFDDETGPLIADLPLKRKLSFGVQAGSDVTGRVVSGSLEGSEIEILYRGRKHRIRSPLIGEFNVYNVLAAFAAGAGLGLEHDHIVSGIEAMNAVPGRMERVVDNVFVDYAHTPAAIENVLRAFRKYTRGRLIIVFGCGGDRDRGKRRPMGEIATALADVAVITSDNPRHEPPAQIIADILQGVSGERHLVIEDRAAAIRQAIEMRRDGDIVVVAGKGHEEYQSINDEVIEFSDAGVIRQCIGNSR